MDSISDLYSVIKYFNAILVPDSSSNVTRSKIYLNINILPLFRITSLQNIILLLLNVKYRNGQHRETHKYKKKLIYIRQIITKLTLLSLPPQHIKRENKSCVHSIPFHQLLLNMASRSREIYEHWMAIQDIIGPAKEWPFLIRRLFWTRFLRHWQRILICAFVYVNGLDPLLFMEWVTLKGLARDASAFNHFDALFR